MKPLAPYGKYLADRIKNNNSFHTAIIFMGNKAYKNATDFQFLLPYTMYLPFSTSPFKYIWPLQNCEVYLVDDSCSKHSFIRFCATCFFSYGAYLVRYIGLHQTLIMEKGMSHHG